MTIDKKILILGAARSGIAAAKILAKNNTIILTDNKELTKEDEKLLKGLNVEIIITDKQEELVDESIQLIVKNPGIDPKTPVVIKANELGIKMVNEMEIAYEFIPSDTFIIGITGSNGKTTTTTMVYEMLKSMGKKVILGGNIGIPLCDIVNKITPDTILVLEISDHQLYNMHEFKTNISLLTNLYETHIDFHGTYENYVTTKKKIFNNHDSSSLALINYNNSDSVELVKDIDSKVVYYNNDINYYNEEGIFVNDELIIKKDDISIVGNHNYENILASLMIINEFGIDKEIVKEFLKTFPGVEHRIEFVRDIDGVKYYNDSKSTNATASITALKTFEKPVHFILGGLERGHSFDELIPYMKNVKKVYAVGEVTDRVSEFAENNNFNCSKCYNLVDALKEISTSKELVTGDVVLLSPASASWDQYKRFEDRGDEFKNFVKNIEK